MSQENVPSLRGQADKLIEALNRRDFDAIAALPIYDPDFQFASTLLATEGRDAYVGTSGLREWAEAVDSVWDDFRIEIDDLREVDGERAVVIYRVTGTARGSGVPLDTRTGQVWTIQDGKVSRNDSYSDPREALEAVGLRE